MKLNGISPDALTFACIIQACGNIVSITKGRKVHSEIIQKGFEEPILGINLIRMYANGGLLPDAQEVFDKLSIQDVMSCNVLLVGYAANGLGSEALKLFKQMELQGIFPNEETFVCVLEVCASLGALDKGREIHRGIVRKGYEKDSFVATTLLAMYAKCGALTEAQEIFDKLPIRDVGSWTALILGYTENGVGEVALKRFERMEFQQGREMHNELREKGFETDISVGNALVDMYCKCGSLLEAEVAFDKFKALSDQLYRTPDHHKFARKEIVNQLKTQPVPYEGYVPMKYSDYLKKMAKSGECGDHVTLQAAADFYGVKICLLTSFKDTCFIEITPKKLKSDRVIFLSFWAEVHYNSIYPEGECVGDGCIRPE